MRLNELSKFTPKPALKNQQSLTQETLGQKTAEYILANCKPWLKASDRTLVYRGIDYNDSLVFTREVRANRQPKDSPSHTHRFFNSLIAAAGGIANRTNSAFVTSDMDSAAAYGTVYVVFPVGKFNYTYALGIGDWYEADDQLYAAFEHIDFKNLSTKDLKRIKGTIMVDKHLDEALYDNDEIMIRCGKLVYVEPEFYTHFVGPHI